MYIEEEEEGARPCGCDRRGLMNQSIKQASNQTSKQSTNQSINQSINQWTLVNQKISYENIDCLLISN